MVTILADLGNKKSLLGVSVDTLVSALIAAAVAIIVLIAGYLLNKRHENDKEKNRLQELEKYFFILLNSLIKPIEKQIEIYRSLATQIASREHQDFVFRESHELFLDNIQNISNLDLYKIFITKKQAAHDEKATHFNDIFDAIEFIRLQKERTKKNFTQFVNEYGEYEKQWNSDADSILRYFDAFRSYNESHGIPPSKDAFLADLDKITYKWSQTENCENMHIAKEVLVDPIKQHCQKSISDQRSVVLLPVIVEANYAFNNLVSLKETYSELFCGEAKKLEENKELLVKATLFFKGT